MKSSKKSTGPGISSLSTLKRPLAFLITAAAVCFGAYSLWEANPNMRSAIGQYIDNGEIKTLEVRLSAEKIMESYSRELLSDNDHTFQRAELKFQPHALFGVKYITQDKKTKEGYLLWSLVNGEMVIDCERWETTHGFEDAINAKADKNDFKILHTLEKAKGRLPVDQLQKELHVEQEPFLSWLENAKNKHLIVLQGNEVMLHFQNPHLLALPQTKLTQCLVSKPYNHSQKISANYSTSQIEKTANAAFGQDFTIRTQETIFLPIYTIDILNPDGSTRSVDFNAVTGQQITPTYLR